MDGVESTFMQWINRIALFGGLGMMLLIAAGMNVLEAKTSEAKTPGAKSPEAKSVSILDFGAKPDSGEDATPAIRRALDECRAKGIKKLVFAPGRYDLWPDRAVEKLCFISNNDSGLKRIGFPLVGLDGLEIDGSGASIVFQKPMVPVLVSESKNVTVRNLSFDFLRPMHSEGKVLAITPESVDVEFSEEYPYVVRNGVLLFTGPKPPPGAPKKLRSPEVIYPCSNMLAFDAAKKEPAYMAKDRYGVGGGIVAKEIGPRQVRLFLDKVTAKPGEIIVFSPPRENPGIVIEDSSGTRLENVGIHNCGGIGVLAQRCRDLFLRKVRIVPPEGSSRVLSIPADPTHFVNMKGKIEMVECVFESQKDDTTNIHGLYARITQKIAPDEIEVKLVHPQQFGIDFIKPGMRLELTQSPTMEPLGYAEAKEVTRLNSEYTLVKTQQPLPEALVVGDCVADADANTAEVLIKDCVFAKNRAHGLVLNSRGKTVVENNYFHTPGPPLFLGGCILSWYEQGGVRDLMIRGNTFDQCGYVGTWGKDLFEVGTGMDKEARKTSGYHKNIVIEDNLFRVFEPPTLLHIYAVDGLKFCNNRLEKSTNYSPGEGTKEMFVVEGCKNLELEKPTEKTAP